MKPSEYRFIKRLWCLLLVLFLSTTRTTGASRGRPSLRLFPFVQARQRGASQDKQEESSSSSETVSEPCEEVLLEDNHDKDSNTGNDILSQHHHSLLQVPSCCLEIPGSTRKEITTIVDTGAQVTVLSAQAAQKCGVAHLMDTRYAGQATGVGSCQVLGRIPAGALLLHLSTFTTIPSPAILVLDNNEMGVELLLGLDFLRDTGAILNLKREEMILSCASSSKEKVVIPFVRSTNMDDRSGGWINKDILSSLENSRVHYNEDHCSDDEEEDGDDDHDLDMSGV